MKKIYIFLLLFVISLATVAQEINFYKRLSDAALELTKDKVTYDPRYYSIPYPNGDVAPNIGVCTDVIIRAYRKLGIDLQKKIHEDMKSNFSKYPKLFNAKGTDKNIDHRRVPNQATFFSRFGTVKKISDKGEDYLPGDIVTWDLGNGIRHVGIVTDRMSTDKKRPLIVHNIGSGQV
ncbi:uncharacterized protein YijF (DUF1287 family) [Dysgonomonas sp. PFB1-18]|uniref:DUF1287 domain-containing protein n=1 Tax=unclassified Dysgonomonas TaxID=2630389 RepID=UPI0024752043|nr:MULTISPECIES: DUF1287 domain-containing protein [unclassified Dysgonomonas]MDH6307701.1 uncharacterized protein YijF (DUF1287 family) [Dysgonomonas sp. PF1-14]MDH6337619.1 uncharacterized protein YijF (DUF1287 family) [Dysgonomonas sp. PF1-16]MDH6378843.1 uncharacterized protein YijF (DUF1287 family) [Dysgonomonas sp. PFB1-18]MDH6396478.1 uncharacterized protein YijF (DUF1287 family) [Dysgonomonas sp. PF1-23]